MVLADTEEYKIRVLLVDDDEKWMKDIIDQCQQVRSNRLEIFSCSTFEDGLNAIVGNGNFDIAMIDYYLDKQHLGFDFIRKAHDQGVFIPYVIVTQASRNTIFDEHKSIDIEWILSLGVSDIIEKQDITDVEELQNRLAQKIREFTFVIEKLLEKYFSQQLVLIEKNINVLEEIEIANILLKTYLAKNKDLSIKRLNDIILDRIAVSKRYLSEIYNVYLLDYQGGETESGHKFLPCIREPKLEFEYYDYVPFSDKRETIINEITLFLNKVSMPYDKPDSTVHFMNKLFKFLEREKLLDESIDLLVLATAKEISRRGREECALELLYKLSQEYSRRGRVDRVAGVDLIIAAFLAELRRFGEAIKYLRSAERIADKSNDTALKATVRSVSLLAIGGAQAAK